LEEPASKVIFLLTSSNPQKLPETILSRVRVVNFTLLDETEILKNLREKYPFTDPKKVQRIAVLSMGRIAKALKLLAHDELFEAYEKLFSDTQSALLSKDIPKAFALIKDVAEDEILTQIFVEIAETLLRKALLQEMENGNNYDILQQKILLIEKLQKVKALLTTNVNVRLMLENFVLAF
jgi:DNA polymerase-3 subunit gamma/tau